VTFFIDSLPRFADPARADIHQLVATMQGEEKNPFLREILHSIGVVASSETMCGVKAELDKIDRDAAATTEGAGSNAGVVSEPVDVCADPLKIGKGVIGGDDMKTVARAVLRIAFYKARVIAEADAPRIWHCAEYTGAKPPSAEFVAACKNEHVPSINAGDRKRLMYVHGGHPFMAFSKESLHVERIRSSDKATAFGLALASYVSMAFGARPSASGIVYVEGRSAEMAFHKDCDASDSSGTRLSRSVVALLLGADTELDPLTTTVYSCAGDSAGQTRVEGYGVPEPVTVQSKAFLVHSWDVRGANSARKKKKATPRTICYSDGSPVCIHGFTAHLQLKCQVGEIRHGAGGEIDGARLLVAYRSISDALAAGCALRIETDGSEGFNEAVRDAWCEQFTKLLPTAGAGGNTPTIEAFHALTSTRKETLFLETGAFSRYARASESSSLVEKAREHAAQARAGGITGGASIFGGSEARNINSLHGRSKRLSELHDGNALMIKLAAAYGCWLTMAHFSIKVCLSRAARAVGEGER
jgi:hypothetical protein